MPQQKSSSNRSLAAAAVTAVLVAVASSQAATAPAFTLSVNPQAPIAGDRVVITVIPQNFSATSTSFTWYRDGVRLAAASGLGRASTTVPTDPGQSENIRVRVAVNPGSGFASGEDTLTIATLPNPAAGEAALAALASDFRLEASSQNPSPGEAVSVSVVTFAFDRTAAAYDWYVNGEFQKDQSGQGRSRLTLAAGREGETKTVRVDVLTPSGDARSKSVAVRAASAPLYWWADTSVPYWYRGKALPALNSRVTVLALPQVPRAGELAYQWQFNGAVVPQASGIGRSTFTLTLGFPVEEQVEVAMRDLAGTFAKSAGVGVRPALPRVGIYEARPLRGVVAERALAEFSAPAGEPYDFRAVPFFFPRGRELRYRWTFNGQEITGAFDRPWLFTIKSNPGEASVNQLNVEVADAAKGGERAPASLQVDLR